MSVLLHIRFDITPEAVKLFTVEGAKKLDKLPGLQWKIWTTANDQTIGAGFYLYATKRDAQIRAKLAKPHLESLPGISNVTTEIYDILDDLSAETRAPLSTPANPSYPDDFEA